jgi:chromosome segregation ATPase
MRQDRSTFATTASELSPMPLSALPADFNPDEFRINLVRQITDKLETGLDRHFSQLVSATTSAALPLSPATSDHDGSGTATAGGTGADSTTTINNLKKLLRTTTAELERVKGKNQELRESNHKLELQHMEATHQVSRLQDCELNNQFLLSRVKELESCASSVDSLETSSVSGQQHQRAPHQHHNRSSSTASNGALQSQNIQRLMREIATLKSERDALKIRSWELEKKPYAQQHQQRPAHFVDLENERNRLVEELGAKTVAMEDLWNKNEGLMVRAKEYEKRVWELEGQCAALEEECAALPTLRSDLVEMEARAVAADALVEKTHDIEGQLALVKSLQDRMQELETTNAELDHSNWDLSERLNIAINQHTLLTKEFESFRSMDEGGRRLEFLANRNRELETLLAEQAKISPDYKDEYERVAVELEKVKVRMPQLEGQAKQVALLRSKTLQLEKQIKTMEELEPRLEEIQNLHERNLFLESELGELEHLRAREMELENELEESKARLMQLETNKARMASFSGLKSASPGSRVRSGSVATAQPNPTLFHEGDENASELNVRSGSPIQQQPSHFQKPLSRRTSQSIGSADYGYGVPMSPTTKGASAWPSGRSSMSMSVNRTSTSSNSSSSGLVLTRSGSPRQTSEDDKVILPAAPAAASMTTEEPESHLVDSSAVAADAMSTTPTLVTQEVN